MSTCGHEFTPIKGRAFNGCPTCKTAHDKEYYLKNKDRRNAQRRKHRKENPEMRRNSAYKSKYGVDLTEKQRMFDEQGGRCANLKCLKVFESLSDACTDHNHLTEKVRALLCGRCNPSLGMMKENSAAIRGLADYIEKF